MGDIGEAAGGCGISAAIGSAGANGTLLFGLPALGLAVGDMAYGLTKIGGVGHPLDLKNHPGQIWIALAMSDTGEHAC